MKQIWERVLSSVMGIGLGWAIGADFETGIVIVLTGMALYLVTVK